MTEKELARRLDAIAKDVRIFDFLLHLENWETGECKVNAKQANLIRDIFNLFRDLRWQIALNSYKQLVYEDSKPVMNIGDPGPVKICPCAEEYGGKTYFGIYIGDIPLSISHSIDAEGTLTAKRSQYNPAIFVPELGKIIFGIESWWGRIESKEELEKLITPELIKNIWYVQLLLGGVEE